MITSTSSGSRAGFVPSEPAPNHRILVVDDNESIHRDFQKILSGGAAEAEFDAEEAAVFGERPNVVRRVPFQMDFAVQGEQALKLIQAAAAKGERYAVAFVDMRMPPGWDGLKTTQKLWEVDSDLQIVICTAYSDYSWEEMIGAVGSPERLLILKKPFDTIEVLQFAHALTEKWSLLHTARSTTSALEHRVAERTAELQGINVLLTSEMEERKRAEEAARQSEAEQRELARLLEIEKARLLAAQAVAKIGNWDFDFGTKARTWSDEGYRILEIPAEPGPSHERFMKVVHPDDVEAVEAAFTASLSAHSPCAQEHRLLMADGRVKFVENRWQVTHDEAGQPLRATGTLQDITESAEAQETLRRSERNLALAQRVSHTGSWEIVLDSSIADDDRELNWSDEQFRIFGFEPRAVRPTEKLFFSLVHEGDRQRVRGAFEAALESPQPYDVEHRITRPDGTVREVHELAEFIRNESGTIFRIIGSTQDITERREVETALRASEAALLLAQQVAHLGSWELDLDQSGDVNGSALRWSDETFRIFGFEPGAIEVTNTAFFNCVHPADRDEVVAGIAELLRSGGRYSLDHRIILPDGQERVVHEEATVIFAANPRRALKVAGTVLDITDRKAAEELLREQAQMLELAHDAIVVRRYEDRVITFWNPGAEQLYGWTAEEAIGKPIDELLFVDQDHYEAVAKASMGTGFRGEVRQVAKDGRALIVNAGATLIRDSDGAPSSVLIIYTDITDHKKLENQFLRAQRLESIGTLASGVAHDLNNVLAPILMSAPLLRDELPAELKEKIIDTIESSAERGAQIVRQVLTFARGVEGERVTLDPRHLIKEMTEIAGQTFPKSIKITSTVSEDLALIEGDPTQLHQVLLNLAVNARDAMPDGGKLALSAQNFEVDEHYAAMTPGTSIGPYVLISVADTGTGIPPHVLEKMFDPFFTTKGIGKGTGLGLSTVLGIVQSHHGTINAYSTPSGTTFRVLLPASQSSLDLTAAATDLPQGSGETILVVDDEVAIRDVAKVLLERNGYQVLVADDGPSALALFAQRQSEITLVLTDYLMPIMSGLALARILRKMNPRAQIILSSGRTDDCSTAEMEASGVTDLLIKPYTKLTLLRTLERVLQEDSKT